MSDLAKRVGDFETANLIATHAAHAEYLENLEQMLRSAAVVIGQDGAIAGTWLRNRKPRKGRFTHYVDRVRFGRRTRAHGRHAAEALVKAAKQVRQMKAIHEDYVEREKKVKP